MKTEAAALGVVALAAAAAITPAVAVPALAGAAALAMWRWPDAVLEPAAFAILAVRPALDVFSERRLGLSEFAPNPDVWLGLAVLWLAIVGTLVRGRSGRPVWPASTVRRAHVWLLAAYGIAAISGARLYGLSGASTGARELVRIASIVGAFLLVAWWVEDDARRYARGWAYLALGLVVPVTTAGWQWATGQGELGTEGLNRVLGTFSHPNSLGLYLVPFVLLAISARFTTNARRLLQIGSAVGLTVMIALTYSRTAMLALVAGLAIMPLLHSRRFGWTGLVRGAAVIVVTAGVIWWLAGDVIRTRFVDLALGPTAWQEASMGISESSFTWRLINWAGLIGMGLEHPVMGHGAGMTTVLNPLVSATNALPFNAHDDFVRFFFEGGLVGVACYGLYGLMMCGWLLNLARTSSIERAPLAYAVAASWIAIFFLTGGVPELSLQTAGQYELYGMAALLLAPAAATAQGVSGARASVGIA